MKTINVIVLVLSALLVTNTYAATTEASPTRGIRITSDDKNFSLRISGRLHLDSAIYDEDVTPLDDDSLIRRGRLAVSGKLYKDWRFRYDYDFAANSDFRIKGAWIRYDGFKPLQITAGNVQEPLSLEEMTSSNKITFMERAMISAFTPSFHMGALLNTSGKNWSAAGGYFEKTIGEEDTDKLSSGWGTAGRLTFAPINEKKKTLHLGISAEYREPNNSAVRYSTRPESYATDKRLVTTRTINNVDDTLIYGLEGAFIRGPWSIQGEYMRANVQRSIGEDLAFDGWYAFVSWFVTGESRRYSAKRGSFRQVKPKGKYGAWELATRFSTINLNDKDIDGGEEDNMTLGVNWYPNRNLRLMANYILVSADPNRNGVKDEPKILQVRAQYHF